MTSQPLKPLPSSSSSPITPTNPTHPSLSGFGGMENKTPTAREREWTGYDRSTSASAIVGAGAGAGMQSMGRDQAPASVSESTSGSMSISRSGSGSTSGSALGSNMSGLDQSTVRNRERDRDRSMGSSDRERDRVLRKTRGTGAMTGSGNGNERANGNVNGNGISAGEIRRINNGSGDSLGTSTNSTSTHDSSARNRSVHPNPNVSSSSTFDSTLSDKRPKSFRAPSGTSAAGIALRLGGKVGKPSGMTSEEEEREREFRYGSGNAGGEQRENDHANGGRAERIRELPNGFGADSYGPRNGVPAAGRNSEHSTSLRHSSSSTRPEEIIGYRLDPPADIRPSDRQRSRNDDVRSESMRDGNGMAPGYGSGSTSGSHSHSVASPRSGNGDRFDGHVESPRTYRTDLRLTDGSNQEDKGNSLHVTHQSFAFPSQTTQGNVATHNLNSPPSSVFASPSIGSRAGTQQNSSPSGRPKAIVFPSRTRSDFASPQQISLPAPPRRSSLPVNEQSRPVPSSGPTDANSPSSKKERRTATFRPGQLAPLNYGESVADEAEASAAPERRTVHHKASSTFRPIKRDTLSDDIAIARPNLNLGSPMHVPGTPNIPESKEVETARPQSVAQGSITSSEALSAESAVGIGSVGDDRRPSIASVASGLDSGVAGIGSVDVTLSSMPAASLPRRVSSRRRLQSYSRIRAKPVDTSMSEATDGGETFAKSMSEDIVEEDKERQPSTSSKSRTTERTTREPGLSRTLTAADEVIDPERRARRGRLKRAYNIVKDDHPRVPSAAMYYSPLPFYGILPSKKIRAHTGTVVGDKIYYLGGCDGVGCWTGMAVFNTESQGWSQIKPEGQAFPALRAHTTTLVGGRLYVIGGGDGGNYSSVVWCYDIENNEWYRPHMRTASIDCPPPRRAHSTVLYKKHLVVFGGGNGSTGLNDVWALDVGDPWGLTWARWNTTGDLPMEMGYHTANLVGHKMIVYGGSDGIGSFSHVHVLDLKTLVWTLVDTRGNFPRLSHSATQVGSYLLILGGHDGEKYAEDVLLLNLVTFNWETKPIYGTVPEGRGYHVTTLHDSRLIVHGGFNGRTHFGDMHVLELAGNAYLPQVNAFTIDERSHRFVPAVKEGKQEVLGRPPPPPNYI